MRRPSSARSRARMRGLVVATLSALAAEGCGAPPPVDNKPSELPLHQTTQADVCLATANAKREKKPNEPEKVKVKHVLVKYAGAKHADASITRTREQACLRAMEARDKLRAGADFAQIVGEYSDEPGAKSIEGLVGEIERKDVLPPFADAAFELDVNEMSDVVETDFGFHVILRTQ